MNVKGKVKCMRLIDADALDAKLKSTYRYFQIAGDISEAPTIDAVHAAGGCYCIECKYAYNMGDNILHCNIIERDMMPDDYCSMGLQKENEHAAD